MINLPFPLISPRKVQVHPFREISFKHDQSPSSQPPFLRKFKSAKPCGKKSLPCQFCRLSSISRNSESLDSLRRIDQSNNILFPILLHFNNNSLCYTTQLYIPMKSHHPIISSPLGLDNFNICNRRMTSSKLQTLPEPLAILNPRVSLLFHVTRNCISSEFCTGDRKSVV